jgi:hypothetical protein
LGARLCEQIPAEQRLRGQIEQNAAIPAVRDMRRVEPLHLAAADGKLRAIREPAGGLGCIVIVGCQHAYLGAKGGGCGRGSQQVIQCAKFVAFKM